MKKRLMLLSVLAMFMGILLTGCMQATESFQVKADGSGSMTVEVFYEKQAMFDYMISMSEEMGEPAPAEADMLAEFKEMGYTLVEKDGREYFAAPDSAPGNLNFNSLADFYKNATMGNMLRAKDDDYVSLTETSVEIASPADSMNSGLWMNSGDGEENMMPANLTEEQLKKSQVQLTFTFDTPIVKQSEGAMLSEDRKTVTFTMPLLGDGTSRFYASCENDIEVDDVKSGRIYGETVAFDLPEGVTATVNGEKQAGTRVVTDQTRTYEVILEKDGTQKTLYYEIDKQAPDIQNIQSNGVYNAKVTAKFCDLGSGIGKVIVDNKDITKELSFDFSGDAESINDVIIFYQYELKELTEGKHTLTVEDMVGNRASVTFTVDKTAPTVTGVKNNKTYKKAVTVKVKDKYGVKSIKLNGKSIKTGKKVSKKGSYKLVVTDKAGNKKTINFKIK